MEKEGPILIVDDDIDYHFLIERIFQKLNIRNPVKFFDNGSDALEYLLSPTEKPSLIFSDIHMPVMNGFDFRAAINASEMLRKEGIPFIYLTTRVRAEERERAKQLSVEGVFEKGRTFEELGNSLRRALEYWRNNFRPEALALKS